MESLNGVKESNVFLPTKIEYNQDLIVKAIDRKIKDRKTQNQLQSKKKRSS
jgi:hypothetical protein